MQKDTKHIYLLGDISNIYVLWKSVCCLRGAFIARQVHFHLYK